MKSGKKLTLALLAAGFVGAAAFTVSAEPVQQEDLVIASGSEIQEFEQRAPTILPPI
ncbi:MAG TPA: hypothetical protein VK947_06415 [Planococcus sp. (in: firmicutes)]|nr:hypothetical protein [Planococcus sp. (in: firmicutes)]